MDGWILERPMGALLLLLPALLLLLSSRRRSERTVLIGTARFFEPEAEGAARSSTRALSASRVAAALALVCVSMALMSPRPKAAEALDCRWLLVLDRSSSMFLPAEPGSETSRLERSIEDALEMLRSLEGVGDARWSWLDAALPLSAPSVAIPLDGSIPAGCLERPLRPQAEVRWRAMDHPGSVWVTDRRPSQPPLHAGFVASGGPDVHGPISMGEEGALVWNGDQQPLSWDGSLRPRMAVPERIDPVVDEMARAWAADRGVELVDESRGDVELVLQAAGRAETTGQKDVRLEADGWWATVLCGPERSGGSPHGDPLWRAGAPAGTPLLWTAPGRLSFAGFRFQTEPAPAPAFAVSMARIFDDALLPPEWLVPLEERRHAGPSGTQEPALPEQAVADAAESMRRRDRLQGRLLAVLLALAGALAALSAWFRARGSR